MEDEEYDFHFPKQCDSGRVTRLEALIHTLLAGFSQISLRILKLQRGTSGESMPSENKIKVNLRITIISNQSVKRH